MTHNHVIHHPRRCSEQKIIGPNTTLQSYACAMISFDTAQPDTRLMLIILAVRIIQYIAFGTFVRYFRDMCLIRGIFLILLFVEHSTKTEQINIKVKND